MLSGGGNLGALQVGMLRALAERDMVPDVILGCSVGAMNGAAFAGDPTPAGVARLEAAWLEIGTDDVMPSSRIPNTVQLLRKGESLHNNDGLRGTIRSLLGDHQQFSDLTVPFQCVATDVDAGLERWFSEGPLDPAILASTALPSVYPMVTIDGRRYVDGGVVDNVPIGRAIELGARRVYVLQVGPHGRPDHAIRRPIDAFLTAYWIARNSRFARDLEQLPEGVEAVVFPTDRPELRYDDFSRTRDLIERGYQSACSHLDRVAEEDAAEPTLAERLRTERLSEAVREVVGRLRVRRVTGGAEAAAEQALDPDGS